MLRTAWLPTGEHASAEDLVQVALVKTHRHWARVAGRGDPTAYVRRVLVTTRTSWWRGRASTEQVRAQVPDQPVQDHHRDPDAELLSALATLPPRMRAVVVLRFYEDLSEARTAELLGCSVGTVTTQTHRGIARLRGLLTPAGQPRRQPRMEGRASVLRAGAAPALDGGEADVVSLGVTMPSGALVVSTAESYRVVGGPQDDVELPVPTADDDPFTRARA